MVTNISTAQLRQLLRLSERKEGLMAQIQRIDRQMGRIQLDGASTGRGSGRGTGAATTRRTGRRRARRGALKEKIVAALRASGKKGVTVRELSNKLHVRSGNLYVWFNSTGRKVPGLKKIGPAKYRLG